MKHTHLSQKKNGQRQKKPRSSNKKRNLRAESRQRKVVKDTDKNPTVSLNTVRSVNKPYFPTLPRGFHKSKIMG
jgi:hypothetical protein